MGFCSIRNTRYVEEIRVRFCPVDATAAVHAARSRRPRTIAWAVFPLSSAACSKQFVVHWAAPDRAVGGVVVGVCRQVGHDVECVLIERDCTEVCI